MACQFTALLFTVPAKGKNPEIRIRGKYAGFHANFPFVKGRLFSRKKKRTCRTEPKFNAEGIFKFLNFA